MQKTLFSVFIFVLLLSAVPFVFATSTCDPSSAACTGGSYVPPNTDDSTVQPVSGGFFGSVAAGISGIVSSVSTAVANFFGGSSTNQGIPCTRASDCRAGFSCVNNQCSISAPIQSLTPPCINDVQCIAIDPAKPYCIPGYGCSAGKTSPVCSDANQIMFKLADSVQGGEAEFYSGPSYTDSVCYDKIFGIKGDGNRTCSGTDFILHLSGGTDAHAALPDVTADGYSTNVCYNGVNCVSVQGSCSAEYAGVAKLSDRSNAHVAAYSSSVNYSYSVCCRLTGHGGAAAPTTPGPGQACTSGQTCSDGKTCVVVSGTQGLCPTTLGGTCATSGLRCGTLAIDTSTASSPADVIKMVNASQLTCGTDHRCGGADAACTTYSTVNPCMSGSCVSGKCTTPPASGASCTSGSVCSDGSACPTSGTCPTGTGPGLGNGGTPSGTCFNTVYDVFGSDSQCHAGPNCPIDANQIDTNDADNDGVYCDFCPGTTAGDKTDVKGCSTNPSNPQTPISGRNYYGLESCRGNGGTVCSLEEGKTCGDDSTNIDSYVQEIGCCVNSRNSDLPASCKYSTTNPLSGQTYTITETGCQDPDGNGQGTRQFTLSPVPAENDRANVYAQLGLPADGKSDCTVLPKQSRRLVPFFTLLSAEMSVALLIGYYVWRRRR